MSLKSGLQFLLGFIVVAASLWRLEQAPRGATTAGLSAYHTGDWSTAQNFFQEASGMTASTAQEILANKNLALAALQAGDLPTATLAARKVAASGKEMDLAWHDFFLGNLAWKRSLRAETEAHGPVPPAGALELAVAQAKVAQEAWQSALDLQTEWGEAQRNLARAATRLAALEEELRSTSGVDTPEAEKMPSPPDASAPPMSEAKQLQLMQQLDRLDQQGAAKQAAEKPKPSGGWKW